MNTKEQNKSLQPNHDQKMIHPSIAIQQLGSKTHRVLLLSHQRTQSVDHDICWSQVGVGLQDHDNRSTLVFAIHHPSPIAIPLVILINHKQAKIKRHYT